MEGEATQTFSTKVIGDGRITIPKNIREKEQIKDGDLVHVQITKIKVPQ